MSDLKQTGVPWTSQAVNISVYKSLQPLQPIEILHV